MKVYIVIVEDKYYHIDVQVYLSPTKAIEAAKNAAITYFRDGTYEVMELDVDDNAMLVLSSSNEGDYVIVYESEMVE